MVDSRTRAAEVEGRDPVEAPEILPEESTKIVGDTGLSMWAGYLGEEYFSELKPWTNEARYVLEARDEVIISTMLEAVKMPMVKAEITAEPASDQEADLNAADFLIDNLDQMHRQSRRGWITDTLESVEFGFAVSEIVLEKRSDGRMWIRNLSPRGQETLRRWALLDDQHPDEVTHFIQGGWRGGAPRREVAIPLDKCVHTTLRGRKGNPQGKSYLRSLYIPFKYVKNYRAMEGIGIERDIGGTPVLELPEGVGLIDALEKTELKKMMEGLRNDEALYVMLPNGMKLSAYTGQKNIRIRDIIRDYEKQMLMRMFAQFLVLGMENVGTQALVEGAQDFFTMSLESIQDEIMEQINDQLVPYLFRYNTFPGTTGLPKLVWAKPGKMDVAAVLEAFSKGAAAKIFTPTRDDEQALRNELGLRELVDGEGEGSREITSLVGDVFGSTNLPNLAAIKAEVAKFDQAAGQDLRGITGIYERFTNDYQRDLVKTYDAWAVETTRLSTLPGRTPAQIDETINRRLTNLSADLKLLARERIGEATGMGLGETLGKRTSSPEVQATVKRMVAEAEFNIDNSVIPGIKERYASTRTELGKLPVADRKTFMDDVFSGRRSRVAQQAGAAQVAIFETQKAAGAVENRERKRLGQDPIPTRWVLDRSAEHCADDPSRATFGCPGLAKVYKGGWGEMPTVPAGAVSCLGNCRCYVEADFGKGWERIV
ncbi:MAG: hypothetical protein KAJ19_27995 [Gammaproteobacteria bacterium]|nr:hypothetical protein [Gammaproteobacteria bacterium]